jgi:hypothetical protein
MTGHKWDGPSLTMTLRKGRPLGRLEAIRLIIDKTDKADTLPWYSRCLARLRARSDYSWFGTRRLNKT